MRIWMWLKQRCCRHEWRYEIDFRFQYLIDCAKQHEDQLYLKMDPESGQERWFYKEKVFFPLWSPLPKHYLTLNYDEREVYDELMQEIHDEGIQQYCTRCSKKRTVKEV